MFVCELSTEVIHTAYAQLKQTVQAPYWYPVAILESCLIIYNFHTVQWPIAVSAMIHYDFWCSNKVCILISCKPEEDK